MNLKWNYIVCLSAVLLASVVGFSQDANAQFSESAESSRFINQPGMRQNAESTAIAGHSAQGELVVPAGAIAGLELRSIINSRTAYIGQMFYCTTIYPLTAGARVAIPAGSFVRGHITRVVTPKRFKGRTAIAMHFDQIVLPNGTTSSFNAELVGISGAGQATYSEHDEAIVGSSSRAKDLARVLKSAAEWSTVGALSAVNSGESASAGGALGGAGGAVMLVGEMLSRADAIVLAPGTNLDVSLDSPLAYRGIDTKDHSTEATLIAQHAP